MSMSSLFESPNTTSRITLLRSARLTRSLRMLRRRCYVALTCLPDYWQQRPSWMRDPLVIIVGVWGGCLLWNVGIAVVIALGTVVAIMVYLAQIKRLYVTWTWLPFSLQMALFSRWVQQGRCICQQQWARSWNAANRPLTLSLVSGVGGSLFCGSVWLILQSTHSLVLTAAIAGQTGAIALIGIMLWQHKNATHPTAIPPVQPDIASPQATSPTLLNGADTPPTPLPSTLWIELASAHPPTRLLAIYRAAEWAQTYGATSRIPALPLQQTESICATESIRATESMGKLMSCLRLMLTYETHPALRQALQEALLVLQHQSSP